MATDDTTKEDTPFNIADLDWTEYIRFRPTYPPALYSIIYAHHATHSNTFHSAIDIGAGAGIVSSELSKRFEHVTVTDPASAYIAAAKAHLTASLPDGHFDFLRVKAEDITTDLLPQKEKVDFVAAAECMHWTDPEVAVPRFADVLKPGGTFAAWLYGPRLIFEEKDRDIQGALVAIMDVMFHAPGMKAVAEDHSFGRAAILARLDNLPFDPAAWTSVRRIYNNLNYPMTLEGPYPVAASKITEGESIESCDDWLISEQADYEYLEGYLACIVPVAKVRDVAKEELRALEKIMQGRTVRVRWPFVLILATKK